MSDTITMRGFVATDPRANTTNSGDVVSSFRLAATERRYDRDAGAWIDGHTNWFTVVGFRQLASNMCGSLKKGQRVIVVGRLRLKQWEKEGRVYHSAEIEAESVGHDLYWGSAKFARNPQDGQRQESGVQRISVEGVGMVDLRTGEMPDDDETESEIVADVRNSDVRTTALRAADFGRQGPAAEQPEDPASESEDVVRGEASGENALLTA